MEYSSGYLSPTDSLNFSAREVQLRTETAEQEFSPTQLHTEKSFVVSLCLRLTDFVSPFLLDRLQAKTTAVLGHSLLTPLTLAPPG